MTLGQRIQTLRKERGFSQEELAAGLDVSRQAVSKWENDISSPDTENLIALSALLGIELSALVTDEQDPAQEDATSQVGVRSFPWLKLVLAVFACFAALFFALWQTERREEEKLELLCHASAVSCLDALEAYENTGKESDFLSATADFRAFMQAYHLLTEDTSNHGNYTYLNEAYGYMLLYQGKIDENLPLLIKAMEQLSLDIYDFHGHDLMYDLYISLRHG